MKKNNILLLIVMFFFLNLNGVSAESSVLTCYYKNSSEGATATILVELDGNDKNRIKINKFDNKKKNNDESDLNENSYQNIVMNKKCPEQLAIAKKVLFDTFSGSTTEVSKWMSDYLEKNAKAKVVILDNYANETKAGYDGGTIDDFLTNKINATSECSKGDDNCLIRQEQLFILGKEIHKQCKNKYKDLTIATDSDEYKKCEQVETKLNEYAEQGVFGNNVVSTVGDISCNATLGSLANWLKKIYNILLLAIPVLIMIFTFKDFAKAIINNKEDELKSAISKFIKRLIFGAVFVALPMLISLAINLAFGKGFVDICIL